MVKANKKYKDEEFKSINCKQLKENFKELRKGKYYIRPYIKSIDGKIGYKLLKYTGNTQNLIKNDKIYKGWFYVFKKYPSGICIIPKTKLDCIHEIDKYEAKALII